MKEMTPAQKRIEKRNEFMAKYGQHWLVYFALFSTASLSFISGIILPFTPDESGVFYLSFGGVLTGLYYAAGFVTNGEFSANYWFDKITDHDEDNTVQTYIAYGMLALSVIVSLVTALAAASQIAFLMGALSEFTAIPSWAQEWVVWSIPSMWTVNAVCGMLFKTLSDEAAAEREAKRIIREARQKILRDKANARAAYWQQKAPEIARRLGEQEAQSEIDIMSVKLVPMNQMAQSVDAPTLENVENPTRANTR